MNKELTKKILLLFVIGIVVIFLCIFKSSKFINRHIFRASKTEDAVPSPALTPTPTPNPDNFRLTKDIDGKTYSFEGIIQSLPTLKHPAEFGVIENGKLIKVSDTYSEIDWIKYAITQFTSDFWYSEKDKILFTVNVLPDYDIYPGSVSEYIARYPKETDAESVLITFEPGLYSRTKILDYFPEQKFLLLRTQGVDGCGGWGTIWQLNLEGERTDLQKYGLGCAAHRKNPTYFGYHKGKVYFGKVDREVGEYYDPDTNSIVEIFSIDAITGIRKLISRSLDELNDDVKSNFLFW